MTEFNDVQFCQSHLEELRAAFATAEAAVSDVQRLNSQLATKSASGATDIATAQSALAALDAAIAAAVRLADDGARRRINSISDEAAELRRQLISAIEFRRRAATRDARASLLAAPAPSGPSSAASSLQREAKSIAGSQRAVTSALEVGTAALAQLTGQRQTLARSAGVLGAINDGLHMAGGVVRAAVRTHRIDGAIVTGGCAVVALLLLYFWWR